MRLSIVLIWVSFCFSAMAPGSENSSMILQLTPDRVADKLIALIHDGTINQHTLVVWDIDDTLIQAGSDYSFFGTRPTHPRFSEIIHRTQCLGTVHIALTNASPFDNDLNFNGGVLELTPIPQIANIYPSYFQGTMDFGEPATFEALRIAGLKHIGIDFTNQKWQKFPRKLETLQFHYDMEQNPERNELMKFVREHGHVLEKWIDANDQKEYYHIQGEAIVPGFEPNNRKRHFIQNGSSFSEVICSPIFSSGIIFCNFINLYTQCYYGTIKGIILRSFLGSCKELIGQTFSNVVFIDDTSACVENVIEVMEEIGMPCIGINILSH